MVKQKNNTNRHAKSTLDKYSYKKLKEVKLIRFLFIKYLLTNKEIDYFHFGEALLRSRDSFRLFYFNNMRFWMVLDFFSAHPTLVLP